MDSDATWYGGIGLGQAHIVLEGIQLSPLPKKGTASRFSVHVCCGQMAEWTKMPLGTEVGLGPGHIVLDGDPAPSPKETQELPHFLTHVYCGQTVAHLIYC